MTFSSGRDCAARRLPAAVLLLLIIGGGFFIRIDSLPHWLENPSRYFFDDGRRPLTLTVDAYYYLDIAEQLRQGEFKPFDPRRQVPQGYRRNPTPPLISVLAAVVADAGGFVLEWVAVVLPTLWGALLGLPVYLLVERLFRDAELPSARLLRLWGRKAPADATASGVSAAGAAEGVSCRLSAAQMAALVAAAVALLSPKLVFRTSLGWFDTDGLNVLFSVFAAYFALQFLLSPQPRGRLLWFGAAALNLLLFLWTWDQSLVAAIGLGAGPLALVLVWLALTERRAMLPLLLPVALLLAVLVAWKGWSAIDPVHHLATLMRHLDYFSNTVAADSAFPSSGNYVSEQTGHAFAAVAREAAGHTAVLIGALAGLALAAWVRLPVIWLLLPMAGVAALSFDAQRFEIFLAPMVGLGIGAFAWWGWRFFTALWLKLPLLLLLLLASGGSSALYTTEANRTVPRRAPVLFEAMRKIRALTPPDTLVWANWSHGHPLVYYSDRTTLADGIWHPASILYALNRPLVDEDFRFAANWMQFYAAHGMAGLQRVNAGLGASRDDWAAGMAGLRALLAAGPGGARARLADRPADEREALLRFVFPEKSRPIVLFLEYLHPNTYWYEAGAWDFDQRAYPRAGAFLPLRNVQGIGQKRILAASRAGALVLDLDQGKASLDGRPVALGQVSVNDGKRHHVLDFGGGKGYSTALLLPARSGVFGERARVDSVFSKLFFELKADPAYFRPLHLQPPYYGLWWVSGEPYAPPDTVGPG